MGFSVSGSAAIIFASMFIAFGMWYTATANSFERVSEAETAGADSALTDRNTHVEITSAEFANGTLTITVNNTGAEQLSLSDTDLLVDGRIVGDWQADNATVEGYGDTDLWMAGEELTITLSRSSQPARVKIVTETGVADTAEVTS
jgi:flagellar protein FlaF